MNSVAEYAEEAYEYLNGSGYDVPSDILKDNVIDNSKIEIGLLPANPVTAPGCGSLSGVFYTGLHEDKCSGDTFGIGGSIRF